MTLAELYLSEESINKDSLLSLINCSFEAINKFGSDSIISPLEDYHHFFLCNRLFLLNLASIYTTGFECPDTSQVIPEMSMMLGGVNEIYTTFNETFPTKPLPPEYLHLYHQAQVFVSGQPTQYSKFNHFEFIKKFVNPLFGMNQKLITSYSVISKSTMDYSLSKNALSIFDKNLYFGQNTKGVFLRVKNQTTLNEIEKIGKMLFYDPILSGNNQRSCASCHKPENFFTDTFLRTAEKFDHQGFLDRNAPSLLNAEYNHLVMTDGKHITLLDQTKGVITNPLEMGSKEKDVLRKVLSCRDYKNAFNEFLQLTPQEKEITLDHIASALMCYYSKFSSSDAGFDKAMNLAESVDQSIAVGFNLFMSKSQCATCHFLPQFNGVKPPFTNSEFEVIGVPSDTLFKKLSADKGRYAIHPAHETMNAFRTGSLRNVSRTFPYMHNGIFKTLDEVIDFYDAGGGVGRGLNVENQTLSSDRLNLSKVEKYALITFIQSLDEDIEFDIPPTNLPKSKIVLLNSRKVGGEY